MTANGLQDRTIMVGRLDDAAVHAWYEAAALFVHPTQYEGSSIVTIEAMSHRRPVVATTAGGLPDKVRDGVTGWLVPPGDAPALAHAERRFAYEEGIRSPFAVRYPRRIEASSRYHQLVIAQDIAPTIIQLAGGRPGKHIQGRSLLPLFEGPRQNWRKSFLIEYWAESALPWLVGMSYKAVRTDRHKYIRWINRSRDGELDELYDLDRDPFELRNVARSPAYRPVRDRLQSALRKHVADALGL